MKKILFFVLLIPVFLVFSSCGTTESVAPTPQSVADEIADEMNEVSGKNSDSNSTDETDSTENSNSDADPTDETDANKSDANFDLNENEQSENADANNSDIGIFAEPSVQISDSESAKQSESAPNETVSSDETVTNEPTAETQNESEESAQSENDERVEKVSDEDSFLNRERENAPMTDERGKISEYPIFEEPEVVVIDLPEEEPQIAEISTSETESESQNTENVEKSETEEKPRETVAQTPPETATTSTEVTNPPVVAVSPAPTQAKPTEKIPETASAENDQTEQSEPTESDEIVPSRSVAVKINQFLDVTYPGKGWTYIGETEKTPLFTYSGRKIGTANTTFSLRAKKAGNTILHFYKNDTLTGEYIDDYLSVTVENKRSAGRVKAPAYADIVPAQPQRRLDRANEAKNQAQTAQPAQAQSEQKPVTKATENVSAKAENAVAKYPAPKNESVNASQNTKNATATKQNSQSQSEKAQTPKTQQSQPTQTNRQSQQQASSSAKTESDIKTVIQTTDGAKSTNTASTTQTADTSAQLYSYAPTSSQSTQENSGIQTEPHVVAENEPWKATKDEATATSADENLLEKAKQDFVDGKFEDALNEAQEYYNSANTRLDEALFLLGQISESNSKVKNIRFAVDSYDMLVKRFPASKLWKEARNRSIYLKRFYIDIR